MAERWRSVPGYEGAYEVSDLGRVRSLDRRVWSARGGGYWRVSRGKIRKPSSLPTGHLYLALKVDGKRSSRQVHRLVLEAFVGPCPVGMEACHNDGDPNNNALMNLRWDTKSENMRDAVRHGTNQNASKTTCKYGHPFSIENTRWTKRRRVCRICAREHDEKRRGRKQAEAQAAA